MIAGRFSPGKHTMSRILTLSFFTGAALLGLVASAAPVPKDAAKESYYPTKKGTTWTYRANEREETFFVSDVQKKDGATIISVGQIVLDQPNWVKDVIVSDAGVFEMKSGFASRDKPRTILELPAKAGDVKEIDWTGPPPGKEPLKWRKTVGAAEAVKTAAGTFEAISVEDAFYRKTKDGGRGELRSRIKRWFAPGVGLVREVYEQDGQAEKEWGVMVSFIPAKP
jgi:hypothetical protein